MPAKNFGPKTISTARARHLNGGGLPDLEWLEGHEYCDNVWDVLSGSTQIRASVLLFDGIGDHSAACCTEILAAHGAKVELAYRGHHAAQKTGYFNYPIYLKHYYEKGVVQTPDHRLIKVEKSNQQLCSTLENELTGQVEKRLTDQVIVEHGTVPLDDLYEALRAGSSNNGSVDMDRLLAGQSQTPQGELNGYELFRVGDAVSCRDIHCAILDSRRLCKDL